jgi:ATP-binding cassette, subfamily G (WHITE), member 2
VCKPGWNGINCNLCEIDNACDALMPGGIQGTCYKGGLTVHQNFQMCQVINRKIVDQLSPQVPEVTFSCKRPDDDCGFQCMSLRKGAC